MNHPCGKMRVSNRPKGIFYCSRPAGNVSHQGIQTGRRHTQMGKTVLIVDDSTYLAHVGGHDADPRRIQGWPTP